MALLWFAAMPGATQAQTRRCDLVGKDTTVTGVTFKKCLDLADLNGDTAKVPQNVTRIANDGLSLCKSAASSGGDVDIVYIYDNSGSMQANYAWISPTTNDTVVYEGTRGCANFDSDNDNKPEAGDLSGTVTIPYWNTAGTNQGTKTIPRLLSTRDTAGCTSYSGDPFNARGHAFRAGIGTQAGTAPRSSAGIMSFTNGTPGVANIVQSLTLNTPANISAVQNSIFSSGGGGTQYRPPLDTAKRWLTTSSITSNPKKAIIFLSDGRPDDTSYTALLNSNMPPVYGIFLGKPKPDTLLLSQLSKRTGGQFFLIPPENPDSLQSVVNRILNVILLKFSPLSAVVTNSTMGQSATSAPADFIKQADGSWLMKLNDIIGLQKGVPNRISVTTVFQEDNNKAPKDSQTINFFITPTLANTSGSTTITSTQFKAVCYLPSLLRIVNPANLAELPVLTEADNSFRVRLRTSPTDLVSAVDTGRTSIKADREAQTLGNKTTATDSVVFLGTPLFKVLPSGGPNLSNGTLESALYDTVIARWVHPRDPQDFSQDTVRVQSSDVRASAAFTDANRNVMTQYQRDASKVYVVIHDQPRVPGLTYNAAIVSGSDLNNPVSTSPRDTEMVTLTEVAGSPGTFIGEIKVTNLTNKSLRDGTLQVSAGGDQLAVIYVDPLYGSGARGTAGFDEGQQRGAQIHFTDASGNALPPNTLWSPAATKLYVSYTDDYAYGRVPEKNVTLILTSSKYGAGIGSDIEKFKLTLSAGATDTVWTGSIALSDVFPPVDSNGTAETSFRGAAQISAFVHDNVGVQQTDTVSDFLLIAFPDTTATLSWKLADTSLTPKNSDGLIITLHDQDFTKATNDSVSLTARCENSIDSVSKFYARETTSGTYVTGILVENQGTPNTSDNILSCLEAETVVITYADPVYGTRASLEIHETPRPIATPPGRAFAISEDVMLSAIPDAAIYYTLDGSTPIPAASPLYKNGDQFLVFTDTTLRAIAVHPGWKPSKVSSDTYTKERSPSTLVLLDANNNDLTNITSDIKTVRVRVSTTQANLFQVSPDAATKTAKDAESSVLSNRIPTGQRLIYTGDYVLSYGRAGVKGNDTLEADGLDTLIVAWQNPYDASDIARDTVYIKPAQGVTKVDFTDENGVVVNTYPQTADSIYIRITTRPMDPSSTYSVTVRTDEIGDAETVALTQVSPGVFTGKAEVGKDGLKHPGLVDVALSGDQLTATFKDPIYNSDHVGNAGFNAQVQESARLKFTDRNGAPLVSGSLWSPAEDSVWIQYSDDWNAGIDSKVHIDTAHLVLRNLKYGAEIGRDVESVEMTLDSTSTTRGTWSGAIRLADVFPSISDNGRLETHYRGELKAELLPHNNVGDKAGPKVGDSIVIAYPDQTPDITVTDTTGGKVERLTKAIDIVIKDQPVSTTPGTRINATVSCLRSGDQVANVELVWNGKDGYALEPPLDKLEGASGSPSDGKLTCQTTDIVRVSYADPVFGGDPKIVEVTWSDAKPAQLYFTSVHDNSVITSVSEAADSTFKVMVEGKNGQRDAADTIKVTLSTPGGADSLTVDAVETGANTGVYTATVAFGFGSGTPDKKNGRIDAVIDAKQKVNRVVVTAAAVINGARQTADLALFSAFDLATNAYVKDENGDGRADHVYFVFDHKLDRLPSGLEDVAWNDPGISTHHQKATSAMLSFLPGSGNTIIVADFSKSQFGADLTGPGKDPFALFPDDNLYGGQKPALADSMGPVIVKAVKKPSNGASYLYGDNDTRFNPDTLIISLSEPLKTSATYSSMLRYSKGCKDNVTPRPVKAYVEPTQIDSLTWIFIVDNSTSSELPLVGDCMFITTDGRFTDAPGNVPPLLGVELEGTNPQRVIRLMVGFPPVAGVGITDGAFTVVNNNVCEGKDCVWGEVTSNLVSRKFEWVPPTVTDKNGNVVEFDPNDPDWMTKVENAVVKGNNPGDIKDRNPESKILTGFPSGSVSAVQVISTGPYRAYISIYDQLGNFVRASTQSFGDHGEDKNPTRALPNVAKGKGLVSWLVWDMKTKDRQPAGQGVYVWKVVFRYADGKTELKYVRTGLLRKK